METTATCGMCGGSGAPGGCLAYCDGFSRVDPCSACGGEGEVIVEPTCARCGEPLDFTPRGTESLCADCRGVEGRA